jgi:hypothetical protein
MLDRPTDLITATEAAKQASRSKSSIRAWVRQKKLTGYRKDPDKSNSLLMISQEELTTFLIGSVSPTDKPDHIGRPSIPSASVQQLREENKILKQRADLAEKQTDMLNQVVKQQAALIEELKQSRSFIQEQSKYLRLDIERANDKSERLQQKIDQMTAYFTMPFWKRWNVSVPLLGDTSQ